jgi:predicted amidohydrolase YtcJ
MTGMPGLVLLNGRVFTARSGEPPFAGGVATVGNRITSVGGDDAVLAFAPPDARGSPKRPSALQTGRGSERSG